MWTIRKETTLTQTRLSLLWLFFSSCCFTLVLLGLTRARARALDGQGSTVKSGPQPAV